MGPVAWAKRRARVGLVLAVGATAPAAAQSATLSLGASGSDLREYESPAVVGASVALPAWGVLGVRLDLRRHTDEQSWRRSTCTGLIPPDSESCRDDLFTSSYALTTVGVGPQLLVPLGRRWSVEGAATWTRAWFRGRWRGRETGVTVGRAPEEAHDGLSLTLGATWHWTERWGLSLAARRDAPQVTTCVSDTYYPWCEGTVFRSLEVGVRRGW